MKSREYDPSHEIAPKYLPVLSQKEDTWMTDFGFDLSELSNIDTANKLNSLIEKGSYRLGVRGQDISLPEVVGARQEFLHWVGVDSETVNKFRTYSKTLTPLDKFVDSMRVMHGLGLNGHYIIKSSPLAMNHSAESIRESVANFKSIGLDPVKIIMHQPSTMYYAPESVQAKKQLIERYARSLLWSGDVKELIESCPSILGFNSNKIKILSLIAADYATSDSRNIETSLLKPLLRLPLEQFVIALESHDESNKIDLVELGRMAQKQRKPQAERKAEAIEIATSGNLTPRIVIKYLGYAGIEAS